MRIFKIIGGILFISFVALSIIIPVGMLVLPGIFGVINGKLTTSTIISCTVIIIGIAVGTVELRNRNK